MGLSIPAGVFLSTDSLSEIPDAMVSVRGDAVSGRPAVERFICCLLYTSDAADDLLCVDLGGCRLINKKTQT